MMYGYLCYEHMNALKVGDLFVYFAAREHDRTGGREIDGEDWFEPGHNPIAKTYADGAKELLRLRDRYLSDFPGLRINLARKLGLGGLFLPCGNGRTVILGFTALVLNENHHAKLQGLVRAFRDNAGRT